MKILDFIKKRYAVILFILIFLLALYIRAIPGTKLTYPRLQAIDPYLIYRISEFLATHGYIPIDNYVGYGTLKNGIDHSRAFLVFYIYAAFYWLLGPIFGINYYWVGVWAPAVLASLQVVVLYFLVKELFNDKRIALLSAFFYAVIPGILYRSAAGFIEKEPIGLIFIIVGLTFFVKSIKVYKKIEGKSLTKRIFNIYSKGKENLFKNALYALLAGITLYLGRIAWGGISFAILFIAIYAFILLLFLENKRPICISLLTMMVTINILEVLFGIKMLGGYNGIIYLVTLSLYVISIITEEIIKRYATEYNKYLRFTPHIIILIMIPAVFIASYIFLDIGNLVNSIIEFATTIETKAVILSTVAESQTAMDVLRTAPTQYGNGYAISVFKLPSFLSIFSTYHFALLGLILASVSIFMTFYKKINRTNLAYIFIIVLFFVALRSTMTFIRMGIMLALAISIAGSFGFIKFIDYLGRYSAKVLKGNTKYWYGIVIIISVLVFSTNLASGYVFANGIYPSLDNAWYDAFIWIRDNTNKSDVVLEWWDFGYWFHYIAKRRTLVDGGYHGRLPTQDIAKFYTEPITEWSLKFLKNYSVDYVMVSPDLIGKFGAMSKIANWGKKVDVLPVFRLSNRYQRGDKMLFEYSMGDQKIIFAFSMKTEGNVTGMGNMTAIYRFGFSQAPIRYIGIGRDVIDTGASNAIDAMVYIMQNAAIFIPPAVKDCAFVRLYLLDGAGLEQYFEKVYDKLGMKIYKVRYDNFPDSVKNWKIENPNIDEEHDEFIPYGIGEE